ncbi:MAG: hypothetical protein TREMPRED_002600 [Tremellales sp. Tagirdzhanova-0007]|nr:MAG: hypothetical protein TREMPRED_002600 [Tremellales sp. Tagirdzhanova-0007]
MRVSTSLILPVFFSVLTVFAQDYSDDGTASITPAAEVGSSAVASGLGIPIASNAASPAATPADNVTATHTSQASMASGTTSSADASSSAAKTNSTTGGSGGTSNSTGNTTSGGRVRAIIGIPDSMGMLAGPVVAVLGAVAVGLGTFL